MRKKLVWVRVLLVLVTFIPLVYAYDLGLTRSTMYDAEADADPLGAGGNFQSIFLDKFSSGSFYNTQIGDTLWSQGIVGPKFDLSDLHSWWNSGEDNTAHYMYGYAYILDPITQTNIKLGAYGSNNRAVYCTDAGMMWYPLPGNEVNTLGTGSTFESYLTDSVTPIEMFPEDVCSDHDDWKYITTPVGNDLSSGVYFLMVGLGGHTLSDINDEHWESSLEFAQFNDDPTFATSLNQASATGRTRFIITRAPLNPTELNTVFGNQVENTSWLCTVAGGQQINVPNIDIGSPQGIATLVTAGMNPSNLCCGDDIDTERSSTAAGSFTYNSITYSCSNGKWTSGTDVETCKSLIVANGAVAGADPYKPILNVKNYPYYQIKDGARDGTDGCCGDDIPGDRGFISSLPKTASTNISQYACYWNSSGYTWLNAMNNGYRIVTSNATGHDIDIVSNSEEWFYCNATGNVNSNGKAIREGESFTNRFDNGEYTCADWFTAKYRDAIPFEETCTWDANNLAMANCCESTADGVQVTSDITQCSGCYFKGNILGSPMIAPSSAFGGTSEPNADADEYIDMDQFNSHSYTSPDTGYNPLASCTAQAASARLCNSTTFCSGGKYRNTTETDSANYMQCCFGETAKCEPTALITSVGSCMNYGGNTFSQTPYNFCQGRIVQAGSISCCVGDIVVAQSYASQSSISDTSFICFKEQGDNILSQCCYSSSCQNTNYAPGLDISMYARRVLTKGASIHTISNFDRFANKTGNALIRNLGKKMVLSGGKATHSITVSELDIFPTFDGFEYLEFDLWTDANDLVITVNDDVIGTVEKYSNNGGNAAVLHRIVIPLDEVNSTYLKKIVFTSASVADASAAGNPLTRIVVIDNIVLVPRTTIASNTKPYYCTGGFEGWVDDLDALPTDTAYAQYAPHMLACLGISSYGWTGTQCCGDDTKPRLPTDFFKGEFFNDTGAGCFAGSIVRENQTVSSSKGVLEFAFADKDELKSFNYADLVFYNHSFRGCQVPLGKYYDFNLSYDSVPTSTQLFLTTNNVNKQCGMVGSYYCSNGVWRTRIRLYNNTDPTFPGQTISLKTAPPGIELLKNGFTGQS